MLKQSIKKNPLKMYKTVALALIGISILTLFIQLLLPYSIGDNYVNTSADEILLNRNSIEEKNDSNNASQTFRSYRTGLFKSAVAFQGKPLADKTIERIKSQLKLQCIMPMNGELAAYILIKGVGQKKCLVGDTVNDMFTVLNIDEKKKCVDISIIDHKVTLYM